MEHSIKEKESPVRIVEEKLTKAVTFSFVWINYTSQIIEENPEKRFNYIKDACKILTLTFPYKKKIREFYGSKDLFFNLMILEIFNKKSVYFHFSSAYTPRSMP